MFKDGYFYQSVPPYGASSTDYFRPHLITPFIQIQRLIFQWICLPSVSTFIYCSSPPLLPNLDSNQALNSNGHSLNFYQNMLFWAYFNFLEIFFDLKIVLSCNVINWKDYILFSIYSCSPGLEVALNPSDELCADISFHTLIMLLHQHRRQQSSKLADSCMQMTINCEF